MADVRQAVVGLEDILKGLDNLAAVAEPVARAMGVAMGQTVRDEAIERAPVLTEGNRGVDNQRPEQLKQAIYLAFDGRRSILNAGHYVYGVSWNARKAPHGHLIEFGHWMPYMYEKTPDGRYYTPLNGTHKVDGRTRGKGTPNPRGPFWVDAHPFLGPAFDAKLSSLSAIAAAAGAATFSQTIK